ncbi:MAG: hypothetical protein QN152_09690 [Armatimonadota bacterium]|nr:hypothetical protein [Armatimonadota bacterium]MDR7427698.1 hypothetical protein [Armatimonadota bacterium]MDR7465164.1 hypothetical protein [Armatimonadota bacterium]MDR7470275.1 hypothetical protein [Armatimonadota bacterium]MDR7475374.1 hypothetical protein [Armatimonadota bacterium]
MRAGFAAFWVLMAILEVARRSNPDVVTWLGGIAPWLVVLMTLLPIVEMVREFRQRRPVRGVRTALWTVLGVVTLLFGPAWLRF